MNQEQLLDYVRNNSFPCYDEMCKRLEAHVELWAEYAEYNQTACKIIYENPLNRSLIVKMGKLIYERGGFKALQANFYTITCFSPLAKVQGYAKQLEYIFGDVSKEWQV